MTTRQSTAAGAATEAAEGTADRTAAATTNPVPGQAAAGPGRPAADRAVIHAAAAPGSAAASGTGTGHADIRATGVDTNAPADATGTPSTAPGAPADAALWSALRRHTQARIGLGRAGSALPTRHRLELQAAHAAARDAVHTPFDPDIIAAALPGTPTLRVHSAAPDRLTYLQRPDLGRRLDDADRARLPHGGWDAVIIIADGLSSRAVHDHAAAVVRATTALLPGWNLAPVVLAAQARVALGDDIGHALGAAMSVVLIGERPGMSAADSLGAYLTYAPGPGRTDADRNCISNIRPPLGLSHPEAARKLAALMHRARDLRLTGVALKDESDAAVPLPAAEE